MRFLLLNVFSFHGHAEKKASEQDNGNPILNSSDSPAAILEFLDMRERRGSQQKGVTILVTLPETNIATEN